MNGKPLQEERIKTNISGSFRWDISSPGSQDTFNLLENPSEAKLNQNANSENFLSINKNQGDESPAEHEASSEEEHAGQAAEVEEALESEQEQPPSTLGEPPRSEDDMGEGESEEGSEEGEGEEEEEEEEEDEEEEEEEEAEVVLHEEKSHVLLDDEMPPPKMDSLEAMYLEEMAAKDREGEEEEEEEEEEKEPEETEEDIMDDLKSELDEVIEDKNKVELMITFYEHRLAHGCFIKKEKGKRPQGQGPAHGHESKPNEGGALPDTMLTKSLQKPQEDTEETLQMRFEQLLKNLERLRKDAAETTTRLSKEIFNQIESNKLLKNEVEENIFLFNNQRREIAKFALFVDNKRLIDVKELERHEAEEAALRKEIVELRLHNIYLRNTLMEKEAEVKQGVNYEEMEQMVLQNQLLEAKIEQKSLNNERVKASLTRKVACITHVKQKTGMRAEEAAKSREQCEQLDAAIYALKEELTELRKEKDYLRRHLELQKRDNGILGQETLLRDMEDQCDLEEKQEAILTSLKKQQEIMVSKTNKLQEKLKNLKVAL